MGLSANLHSASRRSAITGYAAHLLLFSAALPAARPARAQLASTPVDPSGYAVSTQAQGANRFLGGRILQHNLAAARAMNDARKQQATVMLTQQTISPRLTSLTTAWQPVGPNQIASIRYGSVTGRITTIAIDPADASGNTVYLGTTGGGVWKSTDAAGPPASVTFAPLTDTLPVFNANANSAIIPSLSIGAISVQSHVVFAGTGDPNDATDSFYGNGILRSPDDGLTWTLIQQSNDGVYGNHSFTGLGFSGFAWSTASPDTVVAAVSQAAEGALVNAPNATYSVMGLYYSNDDGQTWQMAIIMDGGQYVQRPLSTDQGGNAATSVVWNPVRKRFYAAIRYHGYYESLDGATWTRLVDQPGINLTLANCPTNPDGVGNASCPIFRGVLAVQPVTGDTFALTVDDNNLDQGLWQDICGLSGGNCTSNTVTFGNQLLSAPLETGNAPTEIPQADYDLSLAAVPAGADTLLYAGTVDLYRCSLAAGCHLRNTTNATNGCAAPAMVAPAQHAIVPVANSTMLYLGNDGGLWRSTDDVNQQSTPCSADDATHFQNLNGGLGPLAEVTSFAQHPIDPNTLLVGLGANGTAATSAATAATPWPQLTIGEGGTVAIDQTDPQLWYLSIGAGVNIAQCTNGANCTAADFTGTPTIGSAQTAGDASFIDAPWLLDPALPSSVLIGTCRIWRGPASSGAQWSSTNAISKLLGGPQNAACSSTNPAIRSLAAAGPVSNATAAQNAGSKTLFAGMAGSLDGGGTFIGGHLFSTTAADTAGNNTVWTDLALSPVINDVSNQHVFNPGTFDISSLAADPHDLTGNTIYATVMGFHVPHLYCSIDGGAHWTNITSNLPDAPANSVIVDPNDAKTLYLALDTGVWVTQQAVNCAVPNWSIYGTSLPNAPIIQLAAAPAMPTGDGRTGELRAATYGRGIWQIPLLTAVTIGSTPIISLNPSALAFASQPVATASASQIITVTNTGAVPLIISQITMTGDFDETDTCAATPVAPGLTCTIQVSFLPSVTGSRTGLLTIYANVVGGEADVRLSGTGTSAAAVTLNPVVLAFPATVVNATSATQNIAISNTGSTTAALQAPTVAGDFHLIANTCGATLAPGTGCAVAIAFTPTAIGARHGTFTITDDAGVLTASLSGTGVSPATDALSPLSLTFPVQQLTTTSAPQQITLTNSGGVPLTLIAAQVTSGDFIAVNGCGSLLNPHSTCAINVMFQPQSIGTGTGTLTVSDQYRTQNIALAGTGVAPPGVSLSPLYNLAFPTTGVGQTALPQTITLTNNGGLPLQLQNTAVTGDFSILPGSNTCGAVVAPYTACTMQIVFTPTVGGVRTGTLTIADNAPNSPQTLHLTGTAVDFALSPDGNTTVTITSGQNAVFPLLFTSNANLSGTATFDCTGAPLNASCKVTPSRVPLNATATISVVVLTGVPGASTPSQIRGLWLAALLPLSLFALRRRTLLPRFACLLIVCSLLLPTGCGSGRQLPPSGSSGTPPAQLPVTPAGSYSITVAATSGGLTRTIDLTLIVK